MTDPITRGSVWYGMHFYAGLAEYQDEKRPYRVFLNENTIRSMDPSFAGCPVFVNHVDSVNPNLKQMREEADGVVVESFYNKADGKHWVKFITLSDEATEAIKLGYRLSNCYVPATFGAGGVWNGISYDKEITSGAYEHLALVPNPRYDESVIMTPAQFKEYNSAKDFELLRLANTKENIGEKPVPKFSFFKRSKVENSIDLESMSVELPLSKVEVTLSHLINEADKEEMEKEKPKIAEDHHLVNVAGETMSVGELVQKHAKMCDEMEEMKKPKEEEGKDEPESKKSDSDSDSKDDDKSKEKPAEKSDSDKDDSSSKKIEMDDQEKKKNEAETIQALEDKKKADALRNAADKVIATVGTKAVLTTDAVALGKKLF